jgi:hypothetical protein
MAQVRAQQSLEKTPAQVELVRTTGDRQPNSIGSAQIAEITTMAIRLDTANGSMGERGERLRWIV